MAVARKGQVFVVGAVIISSLLLATAVSYQEVIVTESETNYRFYFQSALNQQSKAFNSAISDNKSVNNIRKGMYGFNSFADTEAAEKGIEYGAFQLVVLPEKEKALIINYRKSQTSYSFYHGSWDNGTILSRQYSKIDIGRDQEEFRIDSGRLDISHSFSASTPRLLGHIEMNSGTTTWRNYILS